MVKKKKADKETHGYVETNKQINLTEIYTTIKY